MPEIVGTTTFEFFVHLPYFVAIQLDKNAYFMDATIGQNFSTQSYPQPTQGILSEPYFGDTWPYIVLSKPYIVSSMPYIVAKSVM